MITPLSKPERWSLSSTHYRCACCIRERDLRVAPGVEVADLVDALDRAGRGAPFLGDVLALHVGVGVFEQRNARRASLLRAPTDDTGLVDVEIAGTGTATPFVFAAVDEIILKPVPAGV